MKRGTLIRILRKSIKIFIPYGIVKFREKQNQENLFLQRIKEENAAIDKRNALKKHLLDQNRENLGADVIEILEYLEHNPISMIPYNFTKNYYCSETKVYYDNESKMQYVLHDNKRLFFPKNRSTADIRQAYNWLRIEQDENSPHRYETSKFSVKTGDVIADIGAAEGIWALSNVEKASKIYLFECETKWIEALEKTFEPWKEKVVIVEKYVSDVIDEKNITLDEYFKEQRVDFIKADIEGAEQGMLNGCAKIIGSREDLKMILSTYHKSNDAENIKSILEKNGFETEFSKGYMIISLYRQRQSLLLSNIDDYDYRLERLDLRKGIIRAKHSKTKALKIFCEGVCNGNT